MRKLPLRSLVSGLRPVETGAAAYAAIDRRDGRSSVVRLNSNEGPHGPFPSALRAIDDAARQLNRYPDPMGAELAGDIARRHGVSAENVLVGPGSTSLIYLIAAAMLETDDEWVYPWPSFPQYRQAAAHRSACLVPVPLQELRVDLDATLAAITPQTRVVVVANPNNPTGTQRGRAELERFVDALPDGLVLLLDEAYAEYAPDFADGFDFVRRGRPVIVLRTFSKIHGLAGLRIGYAVGPADLISGLRRLQVPFAVSHLGLAAARASLFEDRLLAERVRANAEGRDQLCTGFDRLQLGYVPSSANFVLVDVGRDCEEVFRQLLRDDVLVRPGIGYGLPTHIRVTVGLMEENAIFLQSLSRAISE